MATAPAMARNLSTPNASISRNPPIRDMKRKFAGLAPVIRALYSGLVQSPWNSSYIETVGIPPNIEFVQRVLSSGWAALCRASSLVIPFQADVSDWLRTLPDRTSGTNPYASTRNSAPIPKYISISFSVFPLFFIRFLFCQFIHK